ncbi:hypothetical protein SEA_FAUST_249 [Streptomyces phage Faust]|uniref:Uncharacterized protein n=1 Tax=Streptomyces phage Faust TaxID=2767565 RepID=A0A7G9UZ66_9CAUD|nr:hypothetical protein PP456_gp038 [Streptomyces phage Faust]QNN99321.1 hypothetical protein SEA_FAUST_249 [Streptomyces phage Faust]
MKKIVAKLRPNKGLKKYTVYLKGGQKLTVRAENYEVTYFTGSGVCASVKFPGRRKGVFIAPASVDSIVEH